MRARERAWPLRLQSCSGAIARLSDHRVDLYAASIEEHLERVGESVCLAILDERERLRLDRYVTTRTRLEFLASRALLKTVLGRYLAIPSEAVCVRSSPSGRPIVLGPQIAGGGLSFNLSHSYGLVAIGVTAAGELGVDLEPLRGGALSEREMAVLTRFYSPEDRDFVLRCRGAAQGNRFRLLWTRREAYGKALGFGLLPPWPHFALSLAPNSPLESPWSLYSFRVESRWAGQEQYALSVAVRKPVSPRSGHPRDIERHGR